MALAEAETTTTKPAEPKAAAKPRSQAKSSPKRPLRLAMLARNADLYSHKRIVAAARARGHEIEVFDTLRCYMNIVAHRPEVRYRGRSLEGFDYLLRTGGFAAVRDDGRLSAK